MSTRPLTRLGVHGVCLSLTTREKLAMESRKKFFIDPSINHTAYGQAENWNIDESWTEKKDKHMKAGGLGGTYHYDGDGRRLTVMLMLFNRISILAGRWCSQIQVRVFQIG